MSRMIQFIERQKKLARFQVLKSIFSSLVMTVTVVVIAVIIIPASPKAEIIDIAAFQDAVTYKVNITDEDNAILPDTLEIEITSQFTHISTPLNTGDNIGIFTDLEPNQKYTISVLANKGYGKEVLARTTVRTLDSTGGAITNYLAIGDPDYYVLDYELEYYISDPLEEYKSFQLRYGTVNEGQGEVLDYQTVPISTNDSSITLYEIYNYNTTLYIYLEAIDQTDQIVELDFIIIKTPYRLFTSFYVNQVTDSEISISIWPDSSNDDVSYSLVVMRGYQKIQEVMIDIPTNFDFEEFHHFEGVNFLVENLKPNVFYNLILVAEYRNPYTYEMVKDELDSVEVKTIERLNYTIEIIENENDYIVRINTENLVLDTAYFQVWEVLDTEEWMNTYREFSFVEVDGIYQVEYLISKPELSNYRIEVGVKSSIDGYQYIILDEIKDLEGVN
jgi:hypothetical protein